jgi:hypothetical protein
MLPSSRETREITGCYTTKIPYNCPLVGGGYLQKKKKAPIDVVHSIPKKNHLGHAPTVSSAKKQSD